MTKQIISLKVIKLLIIFLSNPMSNNCKNKRKKIKN